MSQTWDYKLIEEYNEPSITGPHWKWIEDDTKLPGTAKILVKMKELGGQGWELVSVSTAGTPIHYYYWFKRLIK